MTSLLRDRFDPTPIASLEAFVARLPRLATPFEDALAGGLVADRIGYAFAAGYWAALRALVAEVDRARATLCATERSGAHPRSIETRLAPSADGFVVRGEKRWSTLATSAEVLLVVASEGTDERGRNRLRLVRVDPRARGVAIEPMPAPTFAPEIPHAVVRLDDVVASAESVFAGDAFERYLRPFRTIEDLFVHAAVLAHGVRLAREHDLGRDVSAALVALVESLRSLATRDPSEPEMHVALAGALALSRRAFDELESALAARGGEAFERFRRDRPLSDIAATARAARFEKAWERLGA